MRLEFTIEKDNNPKCAVRAECLRMTQSKSTLKSNPENLKLQKNVALKTLEYNSCSKKKQTNTYLTMHRFVLV